jgi:hypothetical protein
MVETKKNCRDFYVPQISLVNSPDNLFCLEDFLNTTWNRYFTF